MAKSKIKLLNEDEDDIFEVARGVDIDDMYNELGEDLFDEDNVKVLKDNNAIDKETGFPVTYRDGEFVTLDLEDLSVLDYRFIKSDYIKELVVKQFVKETNNEMEVQFDSDHPMRTHSRDMSEKFIEACLEEDLYEFFMDSGDYIDFNNACDDIGDISSSNLDLVEEIGFPRNIFEILRDEEEDEEFFLSDWYDDLRDALTYAVSTAHTMGAESACLDDFNATCKYATPEGCEYRGRLASADYKAVGYTIKEEFVRQHVEEIWDNICDYSGNDIEDAVLRTFTDVYTEAFDFNEPYAGWYGYDENTMNDALADRLSEIYYNMKQAKFI